MIINWRFRRRLLRRILRLELQVQRLEQLNSQVEPKQATHEPPILFEIVRAFAPLLTGVVLLVLAYQLKDSVSIALEQRRIDQSYAGEAKDLLAILLDSTSTRSDAEVAAITLGSFGQWGVPPLVAALQEHDTVAALAARKGLRTAALLDKDAVCTALISLIENRSQLYPWSAHLDALEQLGQLSCSEAVPALAAYRAFLEVADTEEFARVVSEEQQTTIETLNALRATLQTALDRLKRESELHNAQKL
jgi:hypothetical protein